MLELLKKLVRLGCITEGFLQKSPTKDFLRNTRHSGSLLLPSSVVVATECACVKCVRVTADDVR